MKAQRGSRGTALLFLHPRREMERGVNATPRPLSLTRDPLLTVKTFTGTYTSGTAPLHGSVRPARNVLTATCVINWEELAVMNRQTDRVVVILSAYRGSCPPHDFAFRLSALHWRIWQSATCWSGSELNM
jgi:hypothetical protein